MHQPKILVVGSLVMDLIVGTERFPQAGETIIGTYFTTAPGGKGANQAVQAARLGADVTMVGKVGTDDFGTQLIASAKASGVNTDHILRTDECSSAIGNVQIESANGKTNNRICVVPGANFKTTPEDIAFLKEEIAGYDMVILQLEIPMEINLAVARYAAEKGVPVMLNSAPYCPVPDELLSLITYISPNEHEAGEMTGIPVVDVDSAKAAARELLSRGIKNVIITLGSRGALIADRDGFLFSPAVPDVAAVDPTAAGDSFVGAFCTAVCAGLSHEKAAIFANCTAAVTVSRMGAQPSLPTPDDVAEVITRIHGSTDGFAPLF